MRADILSIGDELTSGQTLNRNASWLSEQLQQIGVRVRQHVTVGDQLEEIVHALRWMHRGADLILITGGLGPTDDDLTRQALATAMGEELITDADALVEIKAFFHRLNRPMPDVNRVQSLRPASARCISNSAGTAPGIMAKWDHCRVFAMPGVPREMKVMFETSVGPELKMNGSPTVLRIATINTFGAGESWVGDKIRDLMKRGADPSVGTTVHDGIVSIRIYARGTESQAQAAISTVTQEVTARLGDLIFSTGEASIESVLVNSLRNCRQTVATAESCTGGLLAELITAIPGASNCFHGGWVTYNDSQKIQELNVRAELLKTHGAVSEPIAEAMAQAARDKAGTNWGISTTGIAGPDGGTDEKPVGTVFIGLAGPDGTDVRRFQFPGQRAQIRLRAAQMAMTMLRLKLLGRPFEQVIPA
ncbi:MAG: competence/damage-inducible protein A [Phycisphaerae bacterium]